MKSSTSNATFNGKMIDAEIVRQAATNVSGVTQAQAAAAAVVYYKSLLAAGLAAGLDVGAEITALRNLGQAV